MVETELAIAAPVEDVFTVLTDPDTYPEWLVGAQRIRRVDDDWPAVGSAFHHVVGVGPVRLTDSTSVVEVEPPGRLVLLARARPTGKAQVEFRLERRAPDVTRVLLREGPVAGPARLLWSFGARPLLARGLRARNERSLAQLRDLVERDGSTSRVYRSRAGVERGDDRNTTATEE
jgi:uncharacterized protein YndB with AHSA1/START domain